MQKEHCEHFKRHKSRSEADSNNMVGQYRLLTSKDLLCSNCKNPVDEVDELCPHCGNRIHSSYCSFCGAPMSHDDLYCGECGGSVKGIPCPNCGTICFRSFCPNCNQAVDDLGKEELRKAMSDPVYLRACMLVEHIVELQEGNSIQENTAEVSNDIMGILDRYSNLQDSSDFNEENGMSQKQLIIDSKRIDVEEDKAISLTYTEDLVSDISSSVKELDELLKSMIPDPGLTPQMQRNYFCARKVAVYHKSIVKVQVGWRCNLCGCIHKSPSECAKPELGGTWVYYNKESIVKSYK